MHVNDPRRLIQNVIVDCGDVESPRTQLFHDRGDLAFQERVAHDYRVVVISTECGPGQCESHVYRLDNQDLQQFIAREGENYRDVG